MITYTVANAYNICQQEISAEIVFLTAVDKVLSIPGYTGAILYCLYRKHPYVFTIIWFGAACFRQKHKLQCTIKTAEKFISCNLSLLEYLYISRTKRKAGKIISDNSDPVNCLFPNLPPGKRFCSLIKKKKKTCKSSKLLLLLIISVVRQAARQQAYIFVCFTNTCMPGSCTRYFLFRIIQLFYIISFVVSIYCCIYFIWTFSLNILQDKHRKTSFYNCLLLYITYNFY